MIFLKLYRFFMGKLRVEVGGVFAERILNLCAHNGITIWAIRRKNDKIIFYITVRDFRALRVIVRKTGIRPHIVKKRGWPFIVKRYSRRYGALCGAAMFFIILQFLSLFVWNINISGNTTIPDEIILNACRDIGIREGVRASSLDANRLKLKLLGEVDGLAWAAINIEGCALTVDVTEAAKKEPNNTDPCNLTANANGIIRKIEVSDGKSLVRVGDSVAEGQLLVSGIYEYKNGNTALVHSEGIIIAEVSESISATVPLKQEINVLSNKKSRRYTLSFFGLKVPLYLGEFGEEYLRDDELNRLESGENYLPIYMHKSVFRKVRKQEITLSPESAAQLAREELDKHIDGMEVLSKEESISENNDSVTVTYDIVTQRDIAKEEILLFSTTN